MNKSNIEAGQPEQKNNNEQTAQNQQVSQPIANTNVVGSLFSQREIKFRAFVRGYIVEVVSIDFINKYITWDDNQYDRCYPPNKCYETESLEEVKLMQFTGYNDWKGKVVYEGDIIKSINGQIELAVVEFNNAAFWLKSYDPMYGEHQEEIFHWTANRIALEVIGNIFENPELLQTV